MHLTFDRLGHTKLVGVFLSSTPYSVLSELTLASQLYMTTIYPLIIQSFNIPFPPLPVE